MAYLALAALAVEKHGDISIAEGLIAPLVGTIAEVNGSKGRGLTSPYYEAEEAIRINAGLDELNTEVFAGHSYTLEAMVQHLARRWLRRHLSMLWERVTRVHYAARGNDHREAIENLESAFSK